MNETLKKIMMTLSLGLLFSAFTGLFAQTASLEEVCKKLSYNQNTTGDFTQIKTLQTNGRKLISTGKFIFCPLGILWQTEKPFPTKDSMTQIAANGKKSVMSGKDNQIFANISETLSSVFSGNAEALKKNFECSFSQTGDSWSIYLLPKDFTIAAVMKSLQLTGTCDSASANAAAALTSLEMTESSENTIRYEFANQKYPKELTSDEKELFSNE